MNRRLLGLLPVLLAATDGAHDLYWDVRSDSPDAWHRRCRWQIDWLFHHGIVRYMQAYREMLDGIYTNPAAIDAYGKRAGVTPALAKQVRDEFYPKNDLDPDRIIGLDTVSADAMTYEYLTASVNTYQLQKPVATP
jgi:hypothetical protein